jgi:predicted O-methyltransferase YrrM
MNIDEYIAIHSSDEPPVLHALNRETHLTRIHPRMLSGHILGRFLSMLVSMVKPKIILEIGTFTGYGTIALAENLPEDGMIHTIEANPELEEHILSWCEKAKISHKVILHIGDALDIIPQLPNKLSMVFIDADKKNYPVYYQKVREKVSSGSIIIADNTLWDSKVLTKPAKNDADTQGIIRFNTLVKEDQGVEKVILPVRDGISVIRVI